MPVVSYVLRRETVRRDREWVNDALCPAGRSSASTPGYRDVVAEVRWEFGPEAGAARQARLVVRPMLLGPDDPIGEDVLLVVSELVSNVVKHARSPGVLRVTDPHPDVPLRVEVEDHSLTMPTVRFPAPGQVGGLGLEILGQLADAWGIEPLVEGKLVWAVFDRGKRSRSAAQQPPPG